MGLFSRRRYDPSDSEYSPSGDAWWNVTCVSDPRFNANGSAGSVLSASMAADEHIRRTITRLSLREDQIPKDIEYSGGKS